MSWDICKILSNIHQLINEISHPKNEPNIYIFLKFGMVNVFETLQTV